MIKEGSREFLNFFGYTKVTGKENPFGFFEFEDVTEEEASHSHEFLQMNKEQKRWYVEHTEEVDKKAIEINKDEPFLRENDSIMKFARIRGKIILRK